MMIKLCGKLRAMCAVVQIDHHGTAAATHEAVFSLCFPGRQHTMAKQLLCSCCCNMERMQMLSALEKLQ
jgi:hypothetical protein